MPEILEEIQMKEKNKTKMRQETILDLGCGSNKTPGALGLDRMKLEGVDIVHDLNTFPYPIEADQFDRIILRHIAEHVNDLIGLMNEIHRIGKPGGIVRIESPHYSSCNAYIDPTHIHFFSLMTFDFFCGQTKHDYLLSKAFRRKSLKTLFWPLHDRFPSFVPHHWLGLRWMAEKHTVFYERFLSFLFPVKEFHIELEILK